MVRGPGSWIAFAMLLPVGPLLEAGYRNYSLPCLAPVLERIDPDAPKTLQEALLAGPTSLAQPLSGIGADAIQFPTSIENEDAQRFFRQGVALLHTLWYSEAERAFRTVVHLEPSHPMGYWGLALANEQRPGRARIFTREARNRTDRNRPLLEQRWVQILANYYESGDSAPDAADASSDVANRSRARIRALEDLVIDYPDDVEAKAFLVRQLVLDRYRSGLPLASHLGVEALCHALEEMAPDHPSRHYQVFLWLEERPGRALSTASTMPQQSPQVADAWRFAAEGYVAAGKHTEAIRLYEAALRVGHANHLARGIASQAAPSPGLASNYAALIDSLSRAGRVREAIDWCRQAISLPRTGSPGSAPLDGSLYHTGKRLYVETLMQSGQWENLLQSLSSDPQLQPLSSPLDQATWLTWKGIALIALDRRDEAAEFSEQLREQERQALIAGVTREQEQRLVRMREGFAALLELPSATAVDDAPSPLDALALPPLVQVEFFRQQGHSEEAFRLLEHEIESRPGQFLPTALYCSLAFQAGQSKQASFRFDRRLRANAALADSGLPALASLAPLAKAMGLPASWRLSGSTTPIDSLPKNLDDLGPRQAPLPPAPEFTLPNASDQPVTLAEFRGRPVFLQFFLGMNCPYCLKQFATFRPHLSAFEEAGIQFLAISSDPVSILAKHLGSESAPGSSLREQFPFPVLADPDLTVFKHYQAFDVFENWGMHASFLIDSEGMIRWSDISHAPFSSPEFVLEEFHRLCGTPKATSRP